MVGSRNASAAGLTFAERLSRQLGEAGLRRRVGPRPGHRYPSPQGDAGHGTIAVLAGGHDRIYPPENEALLLAIVENGGAVISEMPMGWEPRGRDFPRRNRIVSGLSYGVVVVEAARRSGSLITARFALEQGREVFAVPGSPWILARRAPTISSATARRFALRIDHVTNVLEPLIASGPKVDTDIERAACISSAPEELWDELDLPDIARPPDRHRHCRMEACSTKPERADRSRSTSCRCWDLRRSRVDDLARQSGLSIGHVQMALLELEIAGRLERHGGNAVSLLAKT